MPSTPSSVVSLANTKYRPPLCGGGLPTTKVRMSRSFTVSGPHARSAGIIGAGGQALGRPPLTDDLDLEAGARLRDRRGNIAERERAPYPMTVGAGGDPADHATLVPDGLIADSVGVASVDC